MADLFRFLKAHGVHYVRHDHPPVFTCEEELRHVPESGAARTKNLFLRDRRGRRHLMKHLGVVPGAVTVIGLVNDATHAVELYIDTDVWAAPSVHAHPLRNDATLVLSHDDLVRFLAATGHQPRIVTVRSTPAHAP